MVVVERFTATEFQLRSPPRVKWCTVQFENRAAGEWRVARFARKPKLRMRTKTFGKRKKGDLKSGQASSPLGAYNALFPLSSELFDHRHISLDF